MFVTDVGCEEEMTTTSYDKMIIFGHVNKAFSHTSPPFSTFWFKKFNVCGEKRGACK